ncbi:MAG: NAD(P)/FAD-dependent oxidoreductase, partial [Ignavibacteria bacterium]
LGQLFCDGSSQQVIDMLLHECNTEYCDISYGTKVNSVRKSENFTIDTSNGTYQAEHVIIATGGLSIPSLGATNLGYQIARQFGHSIIDTRPALVPLTIDRDIFPCADIAGVSLPVEVSAGSSPLFKESMLFTHKGLSGPAILQISSYLNKQSSMNINLIPTFDEYILNERSSKTEWKTVLGKLLPKRLAEVWTALHGQTDTIGYYGTKRLQSFKNDLQSWSPEISGNEGYTKAEVTAGGVNTKELSSKTMMSNLIDKLYFIGEVVDVTGHLGGYNFQWAWSSAHAAAQSIAEHHG